jgi:hypothetical protein
MNVLVDLLLTKIIEDLSPVTENIERLHRMGYINNFKLAGNQLVCIESRLAVSISDVVVDEILQYDEEDVLPLVCLFAIHELKYRRKGIFMAIERDSPLSDQYRSCK